MTDDIFRSMKAQMEPADELVADLLAKIALEMPSPVTENENVISFRQTAESESTQTKHFITKFKKPIWYYGTAAAASIIVMISTFALLDLGNEENGGVGHLIQSVVDPDSSVVSPADPGSTDEPGQTSSKDGDNNSDPSADDPQGKDQDPDGKGDGDQSGKNGHGSGSSGKNGDDPQNYDDPSANNGNNSDNQNGDGSNGGDNSGNGNGVVPPSDDPPDNGKITPGADGTADINWTSEIVNSSQVASISISGSNYVVGSTVPKSDVGTTLETVTIELPKTSTTNATKVKAKVCKVKHVSSEAAVALDVDGFKEPLIYANANYSPSTLGEFVSDLGLSGNIRFSGTVRCQISHVGYSSNQSYKADVGSLAWTWLLCQSDAGRGSKSSFNNGNSKALFTSTSNPTGSQMKFGVSDNGYLWVSMLGKEFTFHIGSSNAKGFLESVTGESFG